uniref:Putative secreted protein n=1 Tax=Anopheles triannulatus TaxID=58253 RepID=A0A2M4B2U5_9DIPT
MLQLTLLFFLFSSSHLAPPSFHCSALFTSRLISRTHGRTHARKDARGRINLHISTFTGSARAHTRAHGTTYTFHKETRTVRSYNTFTNSISALQITHKVKHETN